MELFEALLTNPSSPDAVLVHVVVAVAADVLPLVYDERAQPQLAARPLRYHSSCNNIQLQFTGKYSDFQRCWVC